MAKADPHHRFLVASAPAQTPYAYAQSNQVHVATDPNWSGTATILVEMQVQPEEHITVATLTYPAAADLETISVPVGASVRLRCTAITVGPAIFTFYSS